MANVLQQVEHHQNVHHRMVVQRAQVFKRQPSLMKRNVTLRLKSVRTLQVQVQVQVQTQIQAVTIVYLQGIAEQLLYRVLSRQVAVKFVWYHNAGMSSLVLDKDDA